MPFAASICKIFLHREPLQQHHDQQQQTSQHPIRPLLPQHQHKKQQHLMKLRRNQEPHNLKRRQL